MTGGLTASTSPQVKGPVSARDMLVGGTAVDAVPTSRWGPMRRLATCLVGAVLALSSLTACGGDGGDDAEGGSDPTTSAETSETPGAATDPTDEPTEEPTEEPAEDGGDGGGGGEYCDELRSVKDRMEDLGGPSADIGEFEQVVSDLRELADVAPSDVEDDWQVLIGGFDTLQQALDDAGLSMGDLANPDSMQGLDPKALRQLTQQLQSLDSKKFEQASTTISQHAESECGFALDES